MQKSEFSIPDSGAVPREQAAVPYHPDTDSSPAEQARRKRQVSLMALEGVEGVGAGLDEIGNEAIIVYARDQDAARRVPTQVDGMKVVVQITGPINALKPR